jgi:hypothetical protein
MVAIQSAPASDITDSSAAALLQEIREKRKKPPLVAVTIIPWLIFTGIAYATDAVIGNILLVLGLLALYPAYAYDQHTRSVVVMYDLEPDAENAFRAVYDSLMQLRTCGAVWSVITQQATPDYKHHAGASNLLERKAAVIAEGDVRFLRTNVTVPSLRLHRDTLYFFPDRIFITNPEGIGAVSYRDLRAVSRVGRFIEDGAVPRDATQVDVTWRFVNKNGGPDRRFANNRPLPILAYQEVLFASETGVRGYLQVSRSNGADVFLQALENIRNIRQPEKADSPIRTTSSLATAPNSQGAT